MTLSGWALTISLFSLVVAMASFAWNVWSKFIFPKPCLGVSFMLMQILGEDSNRKYLSLSVTNFGPGDVFVQLAVAKPKTSWFRNRRKGQLGMLNPLNDIRRPSEPTGPYGGGLPKKLAVGENHDLYFPWQAELFVTEPLEAIGVHDSFRRAHWAPRSDLARVVEQHNRDFPKRN